MKPLDFIERFWALASGSFSSWPSVTTNAIAVLILFLAHNIIKIFYDKLQGMNDFLMNIIVLLFVLTLYGIIYRTISGAFKAVQRYRDVKNKKRAEAHRLENLKFSLLNLSKNEIAILKFVFFQDLHSAWLPEAVLPVIHLEGENILRNIDLTRNKIYKGILYNPYQITHEAYDFLTNMSPEFSKKWRKVKPDWRLQDCQ